MSTCHVWGQLCGVVVGSLFWLMESPCLSCVDKYVSILIISLSSPSRSGLKTLLPLCPSQFFTPAHCQPSVGWRYISDPTQVSDISPGWEGGPQVSLSGPSVTCLPGCPQIPTTAVAGLKGMGTGRVVKYSEWPLALVWG